MRLLKTLVLASFLALIAPLAEASFHIMSIREVYAGSVANPKSQYVVLQMRTSGQNFLSFSNGMDFYAADGTLVGSGHVAFTHDVASEADQSFILIATAEATAEFGVNPDFTIPALMDRRGGRVCFDSYDCFAWGNYTGPTNRCHGLSSANLCITGTPFRATEGLASGRAARRDISAGNPALLEPSDNTVSAQGAAGDDTGDSAADFDYAPDPKPTNNFGTAAAAPTLGKGVAFANFNTVGKLLLSRRGPVAQEGVLRLTPSETAPTKSSAWVRLRQPVAKGFDTTFRFRITPTATSAEGFAFVIQNESNSSLGTGGGHLGYEGITNGIAIEFDTRRSTATEIGVGDPAGNRVSIHTLGEAANSASESASVATSAALTLDDGNVHTARVRYVQATGRLVVVLDTVNVVETKLSIARQLDLTRNAAFVGFTSGSGKGVGDHDILSWTLTSSP
jgi:hypothetical protein